MLARAAVQRITDLDGKQPETVERIKAFDTALSTRLWNATHELPDVIPGSSFFLEDVAEDDESEPAEPICADGEGGTFSQDDFTPDSFDACVNAELLPPNSGNNVVRARVVKRSGGGEDGNPIELHCTAPQQSAV